MLYLMAEHKCGSGCTFFQDTFGKLAEGANLVDARTLEILHTNPAFDALLGYGAGELAGKNISALNAPSGASPAGPTGEMRASLEKNSAWQGEMLNLRKDGSTVWTRVSSFPFKCPVEGAPPAYLTLHHSIAGEKLAEATGRRQLAEITSYYDYAPIGLAALDRNLRFLRVNSLLAGMNGLPAAGHIGKTVRDIVPALAQQMEEFAARMIRTGEPVTNMEFSGETRARSGERQTWLESWYPLKDENGAVTGFTVMVKDITERKRAEEDICRLNRLHIIHSAVSKAIVGARVPQALFKLACRIIVDQGGFRMAWVGLLDDATKEVSVAAWAGHTGDYLEQLKITLKNTPRGRGPTAAAIRKVSPVLVEDIARDPRMAVWRTAALRHGYRSSGAFPLKIGGKAIGTLNLYSAKPGTFTDEEVALFTDLAAGLSLALENHKHERLRIQAETDLVKHFLELETAKKRAEDKNTALREVLEDIESEKNRLKDEVAINADKVLLPIIKKLQLGGGAARKHAVLLEKSLKNLVSSFGRRLTEKDFGLTPRELEICNMIRSGLTAKETAGLLNVSLLTVNKHRGNIRNKLGLANKKANLASFLQKL